MSELDPFGRNFFASSNSFALFFSFGTSRAMEIGSGAGSASGVGVGSLAASLGASFAASLGVSFGVSLVDYFGVSFFFSSEPPPAGLDGVAGEGIAEPSAVSRELSKEPESPSAGARSPSRVRTDTGAGSSSAINYTFRAFVPPRGGYI